MDAQKICPQCRAVSDISAAFCHACGHRFTTPFTRTTVLPAPPSRDDTVDGLSVLALILGIFSVLIWSLPLLGELVSIAALCLAKHVRRWGWTVLVMGIIGLMLAAFMDGVNYANLTRLERPYLPSSQPTQPFWR